MSDGSIEMLILILFLNLVEKIVKHTHSLTPCVIMFPTKCKVAAATISMGGNLDPASEQVEPKV